MNKILCLVLCSLVATSLAQDAAPAAGGAIQVVPLVASLCQQGCPIICGAVGAGCFDIQGLVDCAANRAQCDTICGATCAAIQQCGPDCDAFEAGCVSNGVPQLGQIFCPIQGLVCDVGCVIAAPQQQLLGLLQQSAGQSLAAVQGFVQGLIAQMAAAAQPPQ